MNLPFSIPNDFDMQYDTTGDICVGEKSSTGHK